MQRRLLLLNNPGVQGDKNYAPSVFDATERYKTFFKSALGGYWDDDEILEMPSKLKPDCQSVWLSLAVDLLNTLTTYSVVVFTGHGGAVVKGSNAQECIQLSGGNLFPIEKLYVPQLNIKRTVIIDACRCFVWLNESEQLNKDKETLFNATKDLNALDCRDYYNEMISKSPFHSELIQSTQYGTVARPSQTGSVFCDSLFSVIYNNASTWNMTALGNGKKQECKTTEELVNCARSIMIPMGQNPQFRTNCKVRDRFPFYAVRREAKLV